jgi:two-component system response regulator HydG
VLCDIDMKPMDGITLLKQLKQYDPGAVVVIMTAYASTESAIQALKYGAFDYLQKPFKVDELMQALKRSLEFKRFTTERDSLGSTPAVKAGDFEARLPGVSPKIKRLITQLKKLATAHTPILVSGETGTGHEIAAELLHAARNAADAPMVRIDCRLSSAESMRAGLLGENGAGGTWVQQAKGGTLFLTHLQSLPKEVQAEFISVIRNSSHTFRLVCATEEDLEKLAESGAFNEELFYRVAALPVEMPSLRERPEDIPALLTSIAAKLSNPQFDARQVEFTEDALATLRVYHWPGNLDEFNQVVSQIIATTETRVITSAQLPLRVQDMKQWPTLVDYLAGQEKQYIARVLHACQGDKVRAARALGIDPGRFD